MKIWYGFGSEHSANLVMVGTFKSDEIAQKALDLLNEAASIARNDEVSGHITAGEITNTFSDGIMELFHRTNLSLNYGDPEELLYDFDARRTGNKIVITTEELGVNVFLKVFLHGNAKIEVYSAHDHGGPYGRRTRPLTS